MDSVKRDSINNNPKQPEIPLALVNMSDGEPEDPNLLPSKRENKKSEITILPITPKPCGCTAPCEIIICDVIVQQYMDEGEISFLLAMSIEEEDIDALVTKHCDNEYCDALNIDHNRCRRGLIKLYRCDKSDICDICRVTMSSWKSRLYHKRCKKKDKYRHNNVSKECLLKDKLHLRELEIMEDSRTRRNNYLDPISGPMLALETIQNNKELLIIPKTGASQKPIVTITTVPSGQLICTTPSNIKKPIIVNSQMSNQKSIVGSVITSHNNAAFSNGTSSHLKENVAQQTGSIQFSNLQQNTYVLTSTSASSTVRTPTSAVVPPQSQYIRVASSSSTTVQPTTISNLSIVPPPHIVTNSSSAQSKPLLTPIRVVPITALNTPPSLLHRQQGIPKFCVMAGNMITTLNLPNVQALQPILSTNITTGKERVSKVQVNTPKVLVPMLKRPTFKKPSKRFFCVYCCKHFSTDWYFKKHVAKHVSEKHTPKVLQDSSSNRHGTKRHSSKKDDDEQELGNGHACESPSSANSLTDRTDDKVETRGSHTGNDAEHRDEYPVDETNNRTSMIGDSTQVGGKRIKCEKTSDIWNENVEIFSNGIKIEVEDDDDSLEALDQYDVEDPLTFNENCNAERNEIRIVSAAEKTNSENLEKGVTASR